MVKYVRLFSCHQLTFKALPYGTKLYLKTTDDIVREAIIIGGEFRRDGDGYVYLWYKYKIAGLAGEFWGTEKTIKDNGVQGSFYPKMECITKGITFDMKYMYDDVDFITIFADYIYKAGNCRANGQLYNFLDMCGTWNDCASFRTTKLGKNGSAYQIETEYNLYFNKNGWHGEIPAIDNGEAYHNAEEALSHYKPLVVTFADPNEVLEKKDEEITLSVKIKKSDVVKLKQICRVL